MPKFFLYEVNGTSNSLKESLIKKEKYEEYKELYRDLLEKDIYLEKDELDINIVFKKKIIEDDEVLFLSKLEELGFFDE